MIKLEALSVYLYDQLVGTLINLNGKNLFNFEQNYIDNPNRSTLSLSFKDTYGAFIPEIRPLRMRVPHFFSNLLPEGYMRDYLAAHAGINAEQEFQLLAKLGRDLPGALTILPSNIEPPHLPLDVPFTEEEEKEQETIFRFSLAGIQLKFSALFEGADRITIPANGVGGSWILKLPSLSYPKVPENEYSMMELARQVGINVPKTALIPITSIKGLPSDIHQIGEFAYVIKRFDRDDKGNKIHIEDFAQVFGVFPEKKYNSANYKNIAAVIWAEVGESGVTEFIRRFVFNALIGNGDMHIKNWSLILDTLENGILTLNLFTLSELAKNKEHFAKMPQFKTDAELQNFMLYEPHSVY